MKKTLLYVTVFSIVLFGAGSCKKVGIPDVIPPSVLEIASDELAGDYFVENTPLSEYKIPVGTTTVSNVDRKVNFTYTSTTGAVEGVQYTAPASMIIKAGTALDTLRLKGIFAGFDQGRTDKLLIKISGGDLPIFAGKDTFLLTLKGICPVVLPDFYGNYDNTYDNMGTANEYGPYSTSIVDNSAISTGPTSAKIQVSNVWDYGGNDITVNLDWSDPSPANYTTSIPDQKYKTSEGIWIRGTDVPGSFSSCDKTFILNYVLYDKASGDILYDNQVTTIAQ